MRRKIMAWAMCILSANCMAMTLLYDNFDGRVIGEEWSNASPTPDFGYWDPGNWGIVTYADVRMGLDPNAPTMDPNDFALVQWRDVKTLQMQRLFRPEGIAPNNLNALNITWKFGTYYGTGNAWTRYGILMLNDNNEGFFLWMRNSAAQQYKLFRITGNLEDLWWIVMYSQWDSSQVVHEQDGSDIVQRVLYDFRIDVDPGHFVLYRNGTEVFSVTDPDIGSHYTKFALVWTHSTNVGIWNDVRITAPGPDVCGQPGTVYSVFDADRNCIVDMTDFAYFVSAWLSAATYE